MADLEAVLATVRGRLLSKAQLQDHLIDQYWKTEFVDRQLGEALRSLFRPEPDAAVVRFVHGRVPALSRPDVRASLGRLRATFDFPVVATPLVRAAPPSPARPAPAAPKATVDAEKAVGEGTPWRHVTLGHLIDAGLVRLPLEIFHHYKGTDVRARIESADRIFFNGTTYDSVSIAGAMARLSVVGPTLGRAYPQTNGWTFWEYRAADGSRRQLDTLPRDLHERKVVSISDGKRAG